MHAVQVPQDPAATAGVGSSSISTSSSPRKNHGPKRGCSRLGPGSRARLRFGGVGTLERGPASTRRAVVLHGDQAGVDEAPAQLAQHLGHDVVVVAPGGVAGDAAAALELDRRARVREPDHQDALAARQHEARIADALGVALQVFESRVLSRGEPGVEVRDVARGAQGRDPGQVEAHLASQFECAFDGHAGDCPASVRNSARRVAQRSTSQLG